MAEYVQFVTMCIYVVFVLVWISIGVVNMHVYYFCEVILFHALFIEIERLSG